MVPESAHFAVNCENAFEYHIIAPESAPFAVDCENAFE
jgi:hypothetical protein